MTDKTTVITLGEDAQGAYGDEHVMLIGGIGAKADQEDNGLLIVEEDGSARVVVADGVGGRNNGKIVAKMICDALKEDPRIEPTTLVDTMREKINARFSEDSVNKRPGAAYVDLRIPAPQVTSEGIRVAFAGNARGGFLTPEGLQAVTYDQTSIGHLLRDILKEGGFPSKEDLPAAVQHRWPSFEPNESRWENLTAAEKAELIFTIFTVNTLYNCILGREKVDFFDSDLDITWPASARGIVWAVTDGVYERAWRQTESVSAGPITSEVLLRQAWRFLQEETGNPQNAAQKMKEWLQSLGGSNDNFFVIIRAFGGSLKENLNSIAAARGWTVTT